MPSVRFHDWLRLACGLDAADLRSDFRTNQMQPKQQTTHSRTIHAGCYYIYGVSPFNLAAANSIDQAFSLVCCRASLPTLPVRPQANMSGMSAATTIAGSSAHAATSEGASLEVQAAIAEDPAVAAMKEATPGDGAEVNAGIGKTPSLKSFHTEVSNWAFGPGHIDVENNFAAYEKQLIAAHVLPFVAFEETRPAAINVALPQDRVGAQQLLDHFGTRYKQMKQQGIPRIQMA
jgi:hypothetical protein